MLVVPSLWNEPFGRVVIEAYSHHVPVFMSNNGGLKELAEQGLSRSFSTDSFDDLTILFNKYFQEEALFNYDLFDNAVLKYNQHKVTEDYINLYSSIING